MSALRSYLSMGGPHGMLVQTTQPPAFAVDEGLHADAKAAGLYLSFINAEVYRTFERDRFQELLTDWGYFGAIERRPAWREL